MGEIIGALEDIEAQLALGEEWTEKELPSWGSSWKMRLNLQLQLLAADVP